MKEFRFGVCARPDQIAEAAQAGFDYVELDLRQVLALSDAEYRAMAEEMEKQDIYAEVVCGMLPDDILLVGEGVRSQDIHQALDLTFDMAQALGAELVIFDCEKSRILPHGFDPAMAWRQLGNFIRILQSCRKSRGILLCISTECPWIFLPGKLFQPYFLIGNCFQ